MSFTDASNEQLAGELESLKSNSATTSTEAQSLQAHITKLETSNRDTLSLLDSKSTAYDKLAEELTAQHKKTVDLRREISTLEEKAQTADNTVSDTIAVLATTSRSSVLTITDHLRNALPPWLEAIQGHCIGC